MRNNKNVYLAVGFCLALALLATILATTGCGPLKAEGKVNVTGEVVHKVELDLDNLKTYFSITCTEKLPSDKCYNADNLTCTNCMVADFLSKTNL